MEIIFLIGRILFGGYFIMNGYNHLTQIEGMTGYAKSKNIPSPKAAVIGTGLLLLLGGLSVVVGVLPRIGLILLFIFLVPTTFMMHNYWKLPAQNQANERVNFYKNLALVGAILILFTFPIPWLLGL